MCLLAELLPLSGKGTSARLSCRTLRDLCNGACRASERAGSAMHLHSTCASTTQQFLPFNTAAAAALPNKHNSAGGHLHKGNGEASQQHSHHQRQHQIPSLQQQLKKLHSSGPLLSWQAQHASGVCLGGTNTTGLPTQQSAYSHLPGAPAADTQGTLQLQLTKGPLGCWQQQRQQQQQQGRYWQQCQQHFSFHSEQQHGSTRGCEQHQLDASARTWCPQPHELCLDASCMQQPQQQQRHLHPLQFDKRRVCDSHNQHNNINNHQQQQQLVHRQLPAVDWLYTPSNYPHQQQWHWRHYRHPQQQCLGLTPTSPFPHRLGPPRPTLSPSMTLPPPQYLRALHKAPHRTTAAADDEETATPHAAASGISGGGDGGGSSKGVSGGSWTSMPNLLSLSRVVAAPVLVYWVLQEQWEPAVVLLAVAGVSAWVTRGDIG